MAASVPSLCSLPPFRAIVHRRVCQSPLAVIIMQTCPVQEDASLRQARTDRERRAWASPRLR